MIRVRFRGRVKARAKTVLELTMFLGSLCKSSHLGAVESNRRFFLRGRGNPGATDRTEFRSESRELGYAQTTEWPVGPRPQALRRAGRQAVEGSQALAWRLGLKGPWGLNSRCSIYRRSWTPGSSGSSAGTATVQSCSSWTCPEGWGRVCQVCPGRRCLVQGWGHAQVQTSGLIWELHALDEERGEINVIMEDLGKLKIQPRDPKSIGHAHGQQP